MVIAATLKSGGCLALTITIASQSLDGIQIENSGGYGGSNQEMPKIREFSWTFSLFELFIGRGRKHARFEVKGTREATRITKRARLAPSSTREHVTKTPPSIWFCQSASSSFVSSCYQSVSFLRPISVLFFNNIAGCHSNYSFTSNCRPMKVSMTPRSIAPAFLGLTR